MIFHIPQCRAYVRSVFNQKSQSGFLQDTDIDYAVNEAYMGRVMELIDKNQGYFEKTKDYDIVALTENYALPSLYDGYPDFVKDIMVERVLSDRTIPLEFANRYSESNITTPVSVGDAYVPNFRFRGRNMVLEPTPADSLSGGLRLTYAYMPPRIRSGVAQAGGAATITLDVNADSRDSYYAVPGTRIMIVSGTGAGQLAKVSSYVGSTKVLTVTSSWTTTPDSRSTYSFLFHDDLPEIGHELVCLDAAMSGYIKERAGAETISSTYTYRQARLEKQWRQLLDRRTNQVKLSRPWHPELL